MAFHTEMSNLSPPIICPLPSSLKTKPRREKIRRGFVYLLLNQLKKKSINYFCELFHIPTLLSNVGMGEILIHYAIAKAPSTGAFRV